jgi:GntR family transcriptional regulator
VRTLASSLAINPNTIQRAYTELESEGYIYSIAGKGSFAANRGDVDQARREALLKKIDKAVRELRFLGVSREELVARVAEEAEKLPAKEEQACLRYAAASSPSTASMRWTGWT